MQTPRPKINLHRLREIGWSDWDPIGLLDPAEGWQGQPYEDEYDSYLMKAAGMLRNQHSQEEVVNYLFYIESEYMGLGPGPDPEKARIRIAALVQKIATDPTIWRET